MTEERVRTTKDDLAYATVGPDQTILLHSYKGLVSRDDGVFKLIENGTIPATDMVESMERGTLFFYTAVQYKEDRTQFHNKKIAVEKGVGKLTDFRDALGPQTLFERVIVHSLFETTESGNLVRTRSVGAPPYPFSNDDYVLVFSQAPESYLDALMVEHSVLCSIEPHTPSPVHLENNTLLGRLDGRIQSVDTDELRHLLGLDQGITSIGTPVLQLLPTTVEGPKRGTLYYSLESNSLKFFDGERLRTLKFEDEV